MSDARTADDLLSDLDDSQRQAVTSRARPLAILAPAGSGKTRVLTRRIAWRVATEDAEEPHVLALTFTRKAAGEMKERLKKLGLRGGLAAGTFHGVAYAQLRGLWADRRRHPPTLLSRKGRVLSEALKEADAGTGLTPSALASEIEWAKARLLGPDRYVEGAAKAHRRPPVPADRVTQAYGAYEQVKRRNNMVDFDDLLKLCGDALLEDQAFADAQRWRFRHLFVDEFQDVNPLQLRLLDAWRGDHYDLCVVGDPQQAIYGWNGADPSLLEGFRSLYPSAEVVVLDRNYRSTPQVLAAANHVLQSARTRPTAVQAMQADGTAPRIVAYPTDTDEATAVARAVRDHRAPRSAWSSQAVLVRTHGQISLITEALRAARIPHRVRGAEPLLEDLEVRNALEMLRRDDQPLSTRLPDLDALAAEAQSRGGKAPTALLTLVDLARDHRGIDPNATASGFAAWAVATLQAEGVDRDGDAVTVATFHAAKGLEWPVVHLAGLEDGLVPIGHARTAAARAEEARLLYVAMTRAVRELSGTWAARRSFNGRTVDRTVCPWLRDLANANGSGPGATALDPSAATHTPGQLPLALTPDWRDRLAEQRERLASARPQPAPAVAALRAWREETARVARVEPATILDDHLLEAVARTMPADHDELAAVPGMGRLLTARLGEGLLAALDELRDPATRA